LNRRNWVIIGLLVVGWIVFLGQPTTLSAKLRMIFVRLGTPFVKLGDLIPVVQSRRQLAKQNDQLRSDNDVLRQQSRAIVETGLENQRLRQLLAMKERLPHKTVAARVIGRDASNWWKSIQIDRGSDDGLRDNLAVLNADGLVGKTISVTRGEARVLLITDPNCKASAVIQETRDTGVVAGSGSDCVMTYVSREAKIKPKQVVITSGLGGVFPKGILIGTVTGTEMNQQTGMYQDIQIKPSVDFNKLEEVIVITE
jgi:rod shape-determining protein MreC